ncbi:MAG: hypothetical protein ACK5IQ_11775 [Bacteroidales bacterium]
MNVIARSRRRSNLLQQKQIATLSLAMTTNIDTTILQSYDVGCL